jgi:hypothetical protein
MSRIDPYVPLRFFRTREANDMPYFKVFLNGENFWLQAEGKPARLGFYTTRFVEAENEREAELKAVEMLRDNEKLKQVLNDDSDAPMIYCESVESIEPFDPETVVQHGFTFYPVESDA